MWKCSYAIGRIVDTITFILQYFKNSSIDAMPEALFTVSAKGPSVNCVIATKSLIGSYRNCLYIAGAKAWVAAPPNMIV